MTCEELRNDYELYALGLLEDPDPSSGTQFRLPEQSVVKPAAAGEANNVKVEFAGMAKSAWK